LHFNLRPYWLVFETTDVLKRVAKTGDLYAPVLSLKQKLPALSTLETGLVKKASA
jgi:bifunctional non-homologous end joining protein LigD